MAPRGRPRKYNLDDARMEVAVEHLAKKGWGFDEKVVRKVASELLQEYEEDGSWFFIELDNYALLVEKILEFQETNDHGGGGSSCARIQDASRRDGTTSEQALAITGDALVAVDETTNEQALVVSQDESIEDETTSELALAISGDALVAVDETPNEQALVVSQDESMQDETTSEQALAISGDALVAVYETTNEQALAITGGSPIAASTAENDLLDDTTAKDIDVDSRLMLPYRISDKAIVIRKRRRRRPCYGLIIDDDEDYEPQELLLLTPAGEIDKVIPVPKTEVFRRKRKSMWDLKPEDP